MQARYRRGQASVPKYAPATAIPVNLWIPQQLTEPISYQRAKNEAAKDRQIAFQEWLSWSNEL